MVDAKTEEVKSAKEETLQYLQTEVRRLNVELHDITTKLDASRGQAEQLAQRSAQVMGEVRRIESGAAGSAGEVKQVYMDALDAQQRLLTIRGQMEKLQAQEASIRAELQLIQSAVDLLSRQDESQQGSSFDAREMIFRVMDAQEEERERLARQMHDGPAHSLTNFILQAEICQKRFDKGNIDKARDELMNLKTAAGEAFQRVRGFIFDLRPMMLTDLGLVPTIKRYLDAFESKTGIETEFQLSGQAQDKRPPSYAEVLIFRGVQELMVNARDHGEADRIRVELELNFDGVRAAVGDNGRGFSTGKLSLDATGDSGALGLPALRQRVQLVGGDLPLDGVSGQGATVEISIPLEEGSLRESAA